MRITKGKLRALIREAGGSGTPPGNVIGYIEANIDGDYRYNQQLSVIHDPSTDGITIIVQDAGAVGGMDYHGPGEGRSDYYTSGRQMLQPGAKGKDLVAAIRTMIGRTADTIKRYGKPSKNFIWGEGMWSSGPKGLNVKLANAALQKARSQGPSPALVEMPVSKSRGYGSQDVDKKNPHLAEFAHEIDSTMQHWGYTANVQMFDSGYVGIKVEFTDDKGSPVKWLIVDQPGKVGLEDQSMGYIFFGPGGPIQESNAWVWEKVPYLGRKFGDTNMRDDTRRDIYDGILDTIESMLESGSSQPSYMQESMLRKYIRSKLLKEYSSGYSVPDFQTVDDMERFLDELEPGDPVETDVEDPETFEMMIPAGESMEEQEWYPDSQWYVEEEEEPFDPTDMDHPDYDWDEHDRREREEEEEVERLRQEEEAKYEAVKEKIMDDAAQGGEDWAMDTMSDAYSNPSMWQSSGGYQQFESPAEYVSGYGQDAAMDIASGFAEYSDDEDVRELWSTLSDKDPYNTSWWANDNGRPSKTLFKEIIADAVYGGISRGVQKYVEKHGEYIAKENPEVESR